MTQTNGTNDREEYLNAWAKTMTNIWIEKLVVYNVRDTGSLLNSVAENLAHNLVKNANGDIEIIEHFFNYYGIYVERGTGKEIPKGNDGDLGFTPKRKRKLWFNRKFYYYCMKLAEKMAEISGKEFTHVMQNIIEKEIPRF
ncbi:hypothetical protein [Dysgonomonas macrotermitis]|uniref:Uncharacterized protein n=1 Tax=Dysgonomonas macrotermitis TaxID=1346286 RepID=A0A1M4UJ10_9BACT|nr:hypothetical protein [Dysgonomonas macrotermitis]SHE56540.1 hypothetical protein SAMN05444362_101614 [Dysgonomonas macrotermitis]